MEHRWPTHPRDNVIFELGLFMGALGRGRTFGIMCQHCSIGMPTDLLGVNWITYGHPHDVDETGQRARVIERLKVALGPVAREIRRQSVGLRPEPVRVVGSPEIVKSYPMRGLVTRSDWNGIIRGVERHLWLYGMAELGYADDADVPAILKSAAECGSEIRILLLDPRTSGLDAVDIDERNPKGTLAARVKAGLSRFSQVRRDVGPKMQIRTYRSAPMVSIIRFHQRQTSGLMSFWPIRSCEWANRVAIC